MNTVEYLKLGWCELCLNVADLERSLGFYRKLGFNEIEVATDEGWAVLEHANLVLALYRGHIKENLINFRGGDVFKIAEELKSSGLELADEAHIEEDGSAGFTIRDPDGNAIYFNTHPGEGEV
ncbi:hypothetical protein GX441_03935 [bacterium]|nr:hypothetical protein [bacterium]